MAKRRNPPTSAKQILVRDFNWRMGNLRRIRCSVGSLDPDIRETIQAYVDIQMAREVMYHEKRLEAILDENIDSAESYNLMTTDWILSRAISELQSAQKIPS